jgi:hypothetical protein
VPQPPRHPLGLPQCLSTCSCRRCQQAWAAVAAAIAEMRASPVINRQSSFFSQNCQPWGGRPLLLFFSFCSPSIDLSFGWFPTPLHALCTCFGVVLGHFWSLSGLGGPTSMYFLLLLLVLLDSSRSSASAHHLFAHFQKIMFWPPTPYRPPTAQKSVMSDFSHLHLIRRAMRRRCLWHSSFLSPDIFWPKNRGQCNVRSVRTSLVLSRKDFFFRFSRFRPTTSPSTRLADNSVFLDVTSFV